MITHSKCVMTQRQRIDRQLCVLPTLVLLLLLLLPAPSGAALAGKSQPCSTCRCQGRQGNGAPRTAFQPVGYRPSHNSYPNVDPPYGRYPYYGPWPATDQDIRRNVRNELLNDELLDASGIRVFVRNDVVTLSGWVRFAADYYRAAQDAYAAGARHVLNQLRLRYH